MERRIRRQEVSPEVRRKEVRRIHRRGATREVHRQEVHRIRRRREARPRRAVRSRLRPFGFRLRSWGSPTS